MLVVAGWQLKSAKEKNYQDMTPAEPEQFGS